MNDQVNNYLLPDDLCARMLSFLASPPLFLDATCLTFPGGLPFGSLSFDYSGWSWNWSWIWPSPWPWSCHASSALQAVIRTIVPTAQSAHATLPDESAPYPKPRRIRGRDGPQLEIQPDVFKHEQVRGFAEDWLVPLLVEDLIRERIAESKEG